MKRLIYCMCMLFLIADAIYTQETSDPLANVTAGSGTYYSIIKNDGSMVKGRIISIDEDQVIVRDSKGTTSAIARNEIMKVNKTSYNNLGSIGGGFGIPYGVLGLNADLKIYQFLYASAGIGTGIFVNPMYNIGGKIYFLSNNYQFRPRIGAFYGTNGMIILMEDDGDFIKKSSYNGVSVIAGFQMTIGSQKQVGFDIDLVYLATQGDFMDDYNYYKNQGYDFDFNATGRVKVSMGLRYMF